MILIIDTSHPKEVTVELKDLNKVVASITDHNQFGSQVLLPLIEKILEDQSLTYSDLTAIEVNPGPGSFTGLRVGAAVAQALAKIYDLPLNGTKGQAVELKYTDVD